MKEIWAVELNVILAKPPWIKRRVMSFHLSKDEAQNRVNTHNQTLKLRGLFEQQLAEDSDPVFVEMHLSSTRRLDPNSVYEFVHPKTGEVQTYHVEDYGAEASVVGPYYLEE